MLILCDEVRSHGDLGLGSVRGLRYVGRLHIPEVYLLLQLDHD